MTFLNTMIDKYNRLQLKLFMIPFLNINRDKFLNREIGSLDVKADEAIIRRRCRRHILLCCFLTSFITFLCTLPSNLWISLPLILIDFEQFQFFVFVIQQELLYLYGYKDLREGSRIDGDNAMFLIWLQNEIMLGNGESMKSKIKSGAGFVVRKAITLLITKSPFKMVVISGMRQLFKWFGVIATHHMIDVSVDLLVLVICAFVAALVSLWQFYPMCRKLRKALETIDINEYYAKWQEETETAKIN